MSYENNEYEYEVYAVIQSLVDQAGDEAIDKAKVALQADKYCSHPFKGKALGLLQAVLDSNYSDKA